jgi:hypothetical protein
MGAFARLWGWPVGPPSPHSASDPARADDRALHARLLAGDETAPSDLARAHLGPLAAWLSGIFARVETDRDRAVGLAEPGEPQTFDPI